MEEVLNLESEDIFKSIFESLQNDCVIVNKRGDYREGNETFYELTGCSRDEVIENSFTEFTDLLWGEYGKIAENVQAPFQRRGLPSFCQVYIRR